MNEQFHPRIRGEPSGRWTCEEAVPIGVFVKGAEGGQEGEFGRDGGWVEGVEVDYFFRVERLGLVR